MIKKLRSGILSTMLTLLFAPLAFADATLSVNPPSGSSFSINGSLQNVATIDIVLNYDPSLSAPSVSLGSLTSGTLMVPNMNTPGTIRVGMITTKPINGTGSILQVNFGKGSGNLRIASSKITDVEGKPLQSGTTSSGNDSLNMSPTPGLPFSNANNTQQTTTTQTTTPAPTTTSQATATSAALGNVTISSPFIGSQDSAPQPERHDHAAAAPTAAPATVSSPPVADQPAVEKQEKPAVPKKSDEPKQAPAEELKQMTTSSVLERFRTYQGEKSPTIMMALFKKAVSATVQQEPAIALSDGKTNVKLIAELPRTGSTSPNFAFSEARMISLNKDENSDKWTIEVLPQKGTFKATATILYGNTVVEYPLTIAPPIREASTVEADFTRFLKDSGSAYPQFDFNNDGRHDYIDDFIYTANFLALKISPKATQPPAKK